MATAKNLPFGGTPTKSMEISSNIDWISATYDYDLRDKMPHVLPDDYLSGFTKVRGMNGYSQARQFAASGAIEMWHPDHSAMGTLVVYTAQNIRNACETFNCTPLEILDYLSVSAKISRLDVCLDVYDYDVSIRRLYHDCLDKKVKTRAKQFGFTESATSGDEQGAMTTYIGSTTKRKKLLRIYDKGKQLGLDRLLTRFELETHGQLSNNATHELLKNQDKAGSKIIGMIQGYASFQDTHVARVFEGTQDIKITHPQYRKSNTAQWLLETVAKTLAKECFADSTLFAQFTGRFTQEYQLLINELEQT